MADVQRRYIDDVPDHLEVRVRELCSALPEVHEEHAWVGTRWMVRKRTFAHVLGIQGDEGQRGCARVSISGRRARALRHAGHPFFVLGWGRDAIGMVLGTDTDWDEVSELVTESFCVMAPKKLVALVDRPDDDTS